MKILKLRWLLFVLLLAPAFSSCTCGEPDDDGDDPPPIEVGDDEVLPGQVVDINLIDEDDTGVLPVLEPAISAKRTREIVDDFSWDDTEELAETNEDGSVALHYAMIFVKTPQERARLKFLEPFWSMLPFFPEERAKWSGKTGAIRGTGDGRGVFVFAILPASAYNVLRSAGLDGDPIFEPVVLRDPPDGVERHSSGALVNEALYERGFMLQPTEAGTEQALTRRQALLPPNAVRDLFEAAVGAFDGAREEATNFAENFDRKTWIVDTKVLDTDPLFDGRRDEAPTRLREVPQLMERHWRSQSDPESVPLTLEGTRVRMHNDLWLAFSEVGADGRAVTEAFGGVDYDVCLDMTSDAALITDFVMPVIVCSFGISADRFKAVRDGDDSVVLANVSARDYRTNLMAQFIDSREYARQIFDIDLRQARVLIADFANIIGEINGGRAFAMCNGEANWLSSIYIGILELVSVLPLPPIPGLDAVVLTLQTITSTVLSNDIYFPFAGNDPSANEDAALSRGVPTHEYGHFVLCQGIGRLSTEHLSTAWGDVVYSTLFENATDNADNDNLYVNEAFADFFTYQVAGGANYFNWGVGAPLQRTSYDVSYCAQEAGEPITDPGSTPAERDPATCMDENSGAAGIGATFDARARRIAAIYFDLFDGPRLTSDGFVSSDLYPMSDTAWKSVEGEFTVADRYRFAEDDESIVLPGDAYGRLIFNWGAYNLALGEQAMLDAMARTMRDYGYTEMEICQFFSIHSDDGDCTTLVDLIEVGEIVPEAPLHLDFTLTFDNDATFTWEDANLVRSGFEWELTGAGETRTGEEASDATSVTIEDLEPEEEYVFELWTVNGENRSPSSRRVRVVTYPAAPSFTLAEARPGGARLEWTGDSPQHVVEYRQPGEAFREYATTDELALDVDGLRPETAYEFRVIGVSLAGRRGPASDVRTITTLPVQELWVDPAGNDAGAGTEGDPLATIGEAMTRADADPTVDAIVLTDEVHTHPDFLHITRDLTIRGEGANVNLDLQGTTGAQGCLPPDGVERIMPEVAVLVGPDIRVTIDNVRINAVQSPTSDQCFGVVASVAERLRLTDVTLYLGDDPDATGCMLGLSAADGTQVTLDRTDLYLHRGTPSPDTRGYGVCASDMNQVTLFDSNVQFGEGYNVDGASFSEAAAMTLENVGALHVSRSRVQIANGPTTASADRVFGVIGSVRGTAHFDNSLIRTLNGGVENDAIRLSAPTALLPSYSFYFVTAIAGLDDTSSEELADDEHQGAALRLEGLVSSLTSYNSWFVHAAGHGANARRHSLDFSGVTGRICTIAARNNALQVARYSTGPRIGRSTAHIFLADTEFSNFLYDINAPYSWGADTCPSPSLEIGDNVGLAEPNNDAGPGGDSNTRVAGIDDDGKIDVVVEGADTWTQSADMLRTSGRPYPMVPYGGINLDVDRQDRGDSTTAIGAYEYPDNTM